MSAAETDELRPVLEHFLAPLGHVFRNCLEDLPSPNEEATTNGLERLGTRPSAHGHVLGIAGFEWWSRELGARGGAYWLKVIDADALNAQPLRRRIGYLNALEDLLQHLGHRMERYLPELLALTVVLLEGATNSTLTAEDGAKEVRSRCLRLIAHVLGRFPGGADYEFMWHRLLTASVPLMDRIAIEASA